MIFRKPTGSSQNSVQRQSAGAQKNNARQERERLRTDKKRKRDAAIDAWAVENELFDDDNP